MLIQFRPIFTLRLLFVSAIALLIAIFLNWFSVQTVTAQGNWPCECVSTVDFAINVRAAPNADAEVLTTIAPGGSATGHGLDESGVWVQLEYESGQMGWAKFEFFQCTPTAEVETMSATETAVATEEVVAEDEKDLGENGELCVQVFDDNNGNRIQDIGDGVLQPAAFQMNGSAPPSGQDSSGCAVIAPGMYEIAVALPVGRRAAISDIWNVNVLGRHSSQLQIALVVEVAQVSAQGDGPANGTGGGDTGVEDTASATSEEVDQVSIIDRVRTFAQTQIARVRQIYAENPTSIYLVSCCCLSLILGLFFLLGLLVVRRRRARAAAAEMAEVYY